MRERVSVAGGVGPTSELLGSPVSKRPTADSPKVAGAGARTGSLPGRPTRFRNPGFSALVVAGWGCSACHPFLRAAEDTFEQASNHGADILWVVDDSGSMVEEQQTLASGFQSFAEVLEVSGTDFHLGVITTSVDYADPDRGELIGDPPYLTGADDYVREFQARTQVGVWGSNKEKGLEAAEYALTSGGPNHGFLRPDAQLLIVVVSDEEDCSDHAALEGEPAAACYRQRDQLVPVAEFVDSFESLKAAPELVMFGAIIGTERSVCTNVFASDRYRAVAGFTGGLIGDICLPEWSRALSDLARNAAGIRHRFQLSAGAKEKTIEVWVKEAGDQDPESPGRPVPNGGVNGWTYDPDTWFVTFGRAAVPRPGAVIQVTYRVDPGAPVPADER